MQDILKNTPEHKQQLRAWIYSFILIGYISLFMILGSGGEADTDLILDMDPILLLFIQGFSSVLLFIAPPLIFIGVVLKVNIGAFFPKVSWLAVAMTLLISMSFIVVISAVGEWNMNLDFGDSDFAEWAKRSEDQLKVLTEYLTDFTTPTHFILAFVIIAIIPAIGEELLFRGLIQNTLAKAFRNPHVAIWLTGFIFGAIHLQFYGLFPRMLLGVLFGYLYHWSGKLTIAMIAHLVNNGLALIALYLAQTGTIEVSPEEMEQSAPWPAVIVFALISIFLIRSFYKKFYQENA